MCYLALGAVDMAEERILAKARAATQGRTYLESNDALIGLAALAHTEGDNRLAAELLLGVGEARWLSSRALAHRLAEQVGMPDEYKASLLQPTKDGIDQLRATMSTGRW